MLRNIGAVLVDFKNIFIENSLLFVCSLIVISLVLKLKLLFVGSLWFDEAYGVYISSLHLPELFHKLTFDYSPPLFYVLLHGWIALFGNNDVWLRVLPLSIHLVTIPVVYYLTINLFGRSVGMITSLIVALGGMGTYYAVEVRMYSLVLLIGIVNTYFFLKCFDEFRRSYALGLVSTIVLGLYTHHSFVFVVLTQGLFLGWRFLRSDLTNFWKWVGAYVVVFVLYLPVYLTVVSYQIERLSTTLEYTRNMGMTYGLGEFYVVLFSQVFIWPYLSYTLGLLVLAGVLFILKANLRLRDFRVTYLFLLLLIPTFIVFIRTQNTVTVRYVLVSTYALCVLLAKTVDYIPRIGVRILVTSSLFLVLIISNHFSYFYKDVGYVYKADKNAEFLENVDRKADAIIVVSAWFKYPLERYYQGSMPILGFEPESLVDPITVDDNLMISHVGKATVTAENAQLIHRYIKPYQYIWFYHPESFSDLRGLVLKELMKCHELLETVYPEDIYGIERKVDSQGLFYYFKVNPECGVRI